MITMGEALKNTNWPLLREQKEILFNISLNVSEPEEEALDGIVHFLDAIQDAAVEDGFATEAEVFGKS